MKKYTTKEVMKLLELQRNTIIYKLIVTKLQNEISDDSLLEINKLILKTKTKI